MKKKDAIFVAGHNGLVGSAVLKKLKKDGFKNIIIDYGIMSPTMACQTALKTIDIVLLLSRIKTRVGSRSSLRDTINDG